MKSKFSEIVSKYLFTYGSVAVPGIGTFSISDSSSGFKLESNILTPPTKMVGFSEEVIDEDGLVKYLKNNHGYSRKDAEKKISEYSKKFLNDLLNYGVATIPGIGQLSKYANGEIIFEPAKEFLITSNYMLPELKLTPLSSAPVVEKPTITEIPPTLAPKAKPIIPQVAVPTAATAAAFLGSTEKTDAPQTKPVTQEAKVPPQPKVVTPDAKPSTLTPIEKPEPVKPKPIVKKEPIVSEPVKSTPAPIYYEEDKGFFAEWKWLLLTILGLIGLSILCYKCYDKYVAGDGSSVSDKITEAKNAITGKTSEAEVDIEDYLKDKPKLQKYAKYLTKEIVDTGCVIVVGTFKKSRNVIKMKDKLRRAGLSPYAEVHKGMTRVGVIFPCQDHDLEGYIDTLRRSFDRNAWYLSPEMDVARN